MRLSTKGRYAVMAVVDLANMSSDGPVVLADIARRQEISLSYLEQLFAKLRKGGAVRSVRGPGGGYMLARPPEEMRIADIVIAVDEPIRTTRCTPNAPQGCMKNKSRCITHHLWEGLGNHIYDFLNSVTVADVIKGEFPGPAVFGTPQEVDSAAAE